MAGLCIQPQILSSFLRHTNDAVYDFALQAAEIKAVLIQEFFFLSLFTSVYLLPGTDWHKVNQ